MPDGDRLVELAGTNPLHDSLLHPGGETRAQSEASQPIPAEWGPLRVIEKIGRGRFGDV